MKYRPQRHTFILRSNVQSSSPIIPKVDVHTSNNLQDIFQNHWTMKYRSRTPTFVLRSNVESYWSIIPNKDVHTSNCLQDIRQNHWTMKCSHSDLYLFPGQTLDRTDSNSHLKYDVRISNSFKICQSNQSSRHWNACKPLHNVKKEVSRRCVCCTEVWFIVLVLEERRFGPYRKLNDSVSVHPVASAS